MALVALAIMGALSYSRLPADLNPQVDIPTLTVTTLYPGAGPQEVESLITRPLEDAVGSVNGVKDVFSRSQESLSIISVDFAVGTDLDHAAARMREKVESTRDLLPLDARAPTVARLDINAQPVLFLALYSNGPIRPLRTAVDNLIKPRLSRVPGVATVNVTGGEQREIRVEADSVRLEQNGISISDVVSAIKAANRNIPAGAIVQGRREIGVRTLGAFTSLEEIEQAQIQTQQARTSLPLTVADVATVSERAAPLETITRANGRESVGLIITKASNTNTISVVDGVLAAMGDSQSLLPPGTETVVSRDDSVMVREALDDVNATMILGAILAMTVVFLFLHNLRGTVIVAMALPACLVATFIVMYFASFTLNQMTLLALSLSVGILIDDSIVVLESITRHLSMGEAPEEAAYNGRTEIGFAGMTLTLADVVVFLPIAFMGGIVGSFFRQFGLTVVVATLFSLVVSFTVTPALAARWFRRGENLESKTGRFKRLERLYHGLEGQYRRLIGWALGNRWWVLGFGFTSLAAALLFTIPNLGAELLPATDQGQLSINVELPPDSSLGASDAATREIEHRIAGTPDVINYVTTVGEILGGFGSFPQRGPQYAQINVRLLEKEGLLDRVLRFFGMGAHLRMRTDEKVAETLRDRLKAVPGARITVSTVRTISNTGPPIQLQLRGANLDELGSAAAQTLSVMTQMPGILDPDLSVRSGRPEAQLRIDRSRAAVLGIPPVVIGETMRDAIEGNTESSYSEGSTQIPIRVQLSGVSRNRPEDLKGIVVAPGAGRPVTLGEVASIRMGAGPTGIDRVNGRRAITITAGLAGSYPLGNAENDIRARMADIPLQGIEVHFGGESEAMNENRPYFILALGLAVILVYLVMASLFNSLLNPFIIMFTAPMALIGALAALALTGSTISLVSMIGIVMLTGLMGRNAILLIDYTGTLRSRGMARNEAVAQAGATRLRPILMTTFATIFGMLPVALRIGRASELRAPMAIVVIGGLLVSTVLTLVVIPVLYTLFDDLHAGRRTQS